MFLEWENNSGKFQNNAINDVKQSSLNHVIRSENVSLNIGYITNRSLEYVCELSGNKIS